MQGGTSYCLSKRRKRWKWVRSSRAKREQLPGDKKPPPERVIALTLLPNSGDKAAGQGSETKQCGHMTARDHWGHMNCHAMGIQPRFQHQKFQLTRSPKAAGHSVQGKYL
ncbi:hypothetical protein Baya_1827 [Bagarius yarrelli]|uniref:Uncharacterized protein n=1 Tax=Bagarius yarrelli TaxID=175774 RepID=A0A556TM81_BAGYA|nr:hypothetical protein Baya_1827 [Bagarius yarrelli]